MAFDCQPRVFRLHPFPVVLDPHLFLATKFDPNGDPAGAGVNGVLDEFLDDGGRPLDDFASGNLVGELWRQADDSTHG